MDGRLRLWERIPLPLRIGFAVFSGFMTILGLPSVGDNVADWGTWLSFVGSTVGAFAFPLLGLLGLATFIGLQIAETRARKTPAGASSLAYDLQESVNQMTSLVRERWAGLPNRSGDSHERVEFGSSEYESHTLELLIGQHEARFGTLMTKAQVGGYTTRAEAVRRNRWRNLDEFWAVMSLASQVIRRLNGDSSARPLQVDQSKKIEAVTEWGGELLSAMDQGTNSNGLLVRIDKTPYQAFLEWWWETTDIPEAETDRGSAASALPPARNASFDELRTVVERTLAALGEGPE